MRTLTDMGDGAGLGRSTFRIARSRSSAEALQSHVTRWLAERSADERFRRFSSHFTVLEAVLLRMIDVVLRELQERTRGARGATAYEECRRIDEDLLLVQRLFEWYAEKYDQRLDDDNDGPALRAA